MRNNKFAFKEGRVYLVLGEKGRATRLAKTCLLRRQVLDSWTATGQVWTSLEQVLDSWTATGEVWTGPNSIFFIAHFGSTNDFWG